MSDPIVDEVRRIRDEHAARFGYDLDAIFRDLKEQERNSGLIFVSAPQKSDQVHQTASADLLTSPVPAPV